VRASCRRTLIEIDSRSTAIRYTPDGPSRSAHPDCFSGITRVGGPQSSVLCFSRASTVALRVRPAHVTCSQWFVAHVSRFAEGLHHLGCSVAG